ncbi:MAG: ATP-binding protein [Solirubrobacteraceae bacterium MAG38_C4-C5]|nr:ATP-binding protein [Candidatus Siliceabacter maunaloa]
MRVTLAFAGVMAVVLTATGLFLFLRLGAELDATIEQSLRSRAGDVTALIEQADSGLEEAGDDALTEQGESFAQILDRSGAVVDATPGVRGRALLAGGQVPDEVGETVIVDREAIAGEDEAVRLLATPVRAQDRRLIVVVGATLEEREEALRNLGGLLLVGGPVALLLACLTGYLAVAAALRPVDSMRRRAAAIQAADPRARLPVSPADDEIGRLGTTLNGMLERLEAAFDRERAFVADASHELRTPLAILKTELELALRGGRSTGELEDALRSAGEETDRLVQLAEDLLVIARSDQGRLPIRPGEVQIDDVLDGVRERFARRAGERGAELRVVAAGDVDLCADPLRLEQALGNLVDNALRHGGTAIELSARTIGQAIELHVRDDGPGFPDDFIESAFERFTRGDAARGRGGAGLGLAIVAAVAQAHHGSVGACNPTEGGADVWLNLPREPAAVPVTRS